MNVIRVFGDLVPIMSYPADLEQMINFDDSSVSRRRRDPFIRNPLIIIHRICDDYHIEYRIWREVHHLRGRRYLKIGVDIPAFDWSLHAYGRTGREAKRNLAFVVHREYCRRCIIRTPQPSSRAEPQHRVQWRIPTHRRHTPY